MESSLDDYMVKRNMAQPRRGRGVGYRLGTRNVGGFNKSNFAQRLGGNRTQQGNGPTFKVTGLGNVPNQTAFDARQKLGKKTPVQDARQKIVQNTKFADARTRIQNKKPADARSRIESAKAKKDARGTIKARQGTPGTANGNHGNTGPQIRVTGLGNVASDGQVVSTSGGLTKTIRVNESSGTTILTPQLLRTINNEQAVSQKIQIPVHITRQVPIKKTITTGAPPPQRRLGPGSGITVINKRRPVQATSAMAKLSLSRSQPQPHYDHDDREYDYEAPDIPTPVSLRTSYQYYDEPEPEPQPPKIITRPPQKRTSGVMSRLSDPNPRTEISTSDDMSPLQGFRVMVTNLHPVVTQEDVVELFGAVGALKKARLIKLGTAEIVFVKKEEAQAAVRKYHMRELDGQPMQVVLTTPIPQETLAAPKPKPAPPPSSAAGPLRLAGSQAAEASQPQAMDVSLEAGLIHKALFRTSSRDDPPSRPVTFTVKI